MDSNTQTSDSDKTGAGTQTTTTTPAAITKDTQGRLDFEGKKWVPEHDLLTVKKGLEGQLENVQSASAQVITDLKTTSDKHYQASLQEQAAKEAVEAKLKEANAKVEDVEQLRTNLADQTKAREALEPKLLALKKSNLAIQYKVSEDALNDKTLEQLDTLEEALRLVGPGAGTRNYDVSGGGSGSASGTPFAAELAELAEAKSKSK